MISLNCLADFGNLIRIAHDFHPRSGIIDKGVERDQTQAGSQCSRSVDPIQSDKSFR
jgi:hypothetical protein